MFSLVPTESSEGGDWPNLASISLAGELDHCLRDRGMLTGTMSVSTLEGYLVALIVGPGAPPEEDWLPQVWAGSRLAC